MRSSTNGATPDPRTLDDHARRLAEYEQRREQRAKRERNEARVQLWSRSGVDARHATRRLDELLLHDRWADHYLKAQRAVEAGGMILLTGNWGTGKTQLAAELVREACRNLRPALYVRAREMGAHIRRSYQPGGDEMKAVSRFVKPHLLVIDELHHRPDTDHEHKTMSLILDKRYAAQRPTVLIANLTWEEFEADVGPGVTDRLYEGGGVLTFDWPSLRGGRV